MRRRDEPRKRQKRRIWRLFGAALIVVTQLMMLFGRHHDDSLRWMNWTLLVLAVVLFIGSLISDRFPENVI